MTPPNSAGHYNPPTSESPGMILPGVLSTNRPHRSSCLDMLLALEHLFEGLGLAAIEMVQRPNNFRRTTCFT